MEVAEMAALKRAEVEVIKHFISKRRDEFRPAYGHRKVSYPRGCIFIGSSNNDDFIQDQTGGRRFWPVKIVKSFENKRRVFNELGRERGQIWAEAVRGWSNSEPLQLTERLELLAEEVQESHTEKDPWVSMIKEYLETLLPDNWGEMSIWDRKAYLQGDETQPKGSAPRDEATARDIWLECLGGDRKSFSSGIGKRIAFAMVKMTGWHLSERKVKREGNMIRVYVRDAANEK